MKHPTYPRLRPDGMAPVLDRNIATLRARREHEQATAPLPDRVAEIITRFTGSMAFVVMHLVIVAAWVAMNLGMVAAMPPFDETFVILATAASVEAIFLSTFVLISQNRAAQAADRRADLDLQINLLAEHEITRLITLTRAIAHHLGVDEANDPALREAEREIAPEKVLDELEEKGTDPGRS